MSNYTEKETQAVIAAAPLTFEKAAEVAAAIGKTQRSVIAKAKSLNVEYIPKAKPKAKEKGITKAELLEGIRKSLGVADREGDLTKAELSAVLASLS
jgi:hypothetical protein